MIDGWVRPCYQSPAELEAPVARFVSPLWTALDLVTAPKDAPDDTYEHRHSINDLSIPAGTR